MSAPTRPSIPVGVRRTTKYKALLAIGLDPDTAYAKYVDLTKPKPAPAPEPMTPEQAVAKLVTEGGWTEAEAKVILAQGTATETATEPKELTPKEQADAMVAERKLKHTKGRTYATGAVNEAITRVLKTGRPEIVQTAGEGEDKHVVGVVIFPAGKGVVACQNLTDPA